MKAPLPTWVSWIGHANLKAAAGEAGAGLGPIAQAVSFKAFARIVLLSDAPLTAESVTTPALTIHLSPGTPAMAAVWLLLAKTRFPAELIQSSAAHGVEVAVVPFDIAAEFLPDALQQADRRLSELSAGQPPAWAEFSAIVYRSAVMDQLVTRTQKVALRSMPVLIEGESGTHKELLARAIHAASPRRDQRFI